jgi:Na+/melibiose symporter-like transporter
VLTRTSLLGSVPYNTLVIQLPQRFQIVEDNSAIRAGVRLIPFNLFISFGAALSNTLAGKLKAPPIYVCAVGAAFEAIGIGLMISLPTNSHAPGVMYIYQILGGLGIGFIMGITLALPPFVVEQRDRGM